MANQTTLCTLCNKRVKPHDVSVTCTLCSRPTHSQCLPIYTTDDFNYAANTNGHWSCTSCLENIFPFYSIESNENIHQELNNHSQNMLDIYVFQIREIRVCRSKLRGFLFSKRVGGCEYGYR
jgi:hypothetical protein